MEYFSEKTGAVTPEFVNLGGVRITEVVGPGDGVAHLANAGGVIVDLKIRGIEIQPGPDLFGLPTVLPDGKKGEMRFLSHIMAPYGGGVTRRINPAFAEKVRVQTGVDPRKLPMFQHGFLNVLNFPLLGNISDEQAEAELNFPGADYYPFAFDARTDVLFNPDGSFERHNAITAKANLIDPNLPIPVSIGMHNFKLVEGGDAGVAAVRFYDENQRLLLDMANYHMTESDQREFPLPPSYYIELPHCNLKIENLGGYLQDSILNIWTDTRYWRGPDSAYAKGEWYTRDMLKMLARQANERHGLSLSIGDIRDLIIKYQNRRYVCDEPFRNSFGALREHPGPVLLEPGQTLSVGQRITVL